MYLGRWTGRQHQAQWKQLPGSSREKCPKGLPTYWELLPNKGGFRNGKIRGVLAFSSLPKPTVTVPIEIQQRTSPSGFPASKLCLQGTDISVCFFLSCILWLHQGNAKAPKRCRIIYWLKRSMLLFMEHCRAGRMESLVVSLNGIKWSLWVYRY